MANMMSHDLDGSDSIATSADVEMKGRIDQHEQACKVKLNPLLEDEELNGELLDDNVEALRG